MRIGRKLRILCVEKEKINSKHIILLSNGHLSHPEANPPSTSPVPSHILSSVFKIARLVMNDPLR
jgi:hypothetical protein